MSLSSAAERDESARETGSQPPRLSICIPTYNRQRMVIALVEQLLAQPGNFEVRVHVDGSSDGTLKALSKISDPRVHVTSGPNRGRASALASAVGAASGEFTMLFDDDDELWPQGLAMVLEDCAAPPPPGIAGYAYHLVDDSGVRLGDDFPVEQSNFLRVRNDFKVRGDKKEVVLTDLLKPVVERTRRLGRRVPTSLYWTTISLEHDVIFRNVDIGRKHYEVGGMSHGIRHLKRANPRPLVALYRAQVKGFGKGRFHSPLAGARALLALTYYYASSVAAR
jgi:glycosyltransferase involved in cell wall biosynthesis